MLAYGHVSAVVWKYMNEPQAPFKTLGDHLRYLREQVKESLAIVAGAVEIDEQKLERIEAGKERPDEEILLLLINHFAMQDQEAVQLWELAGYNGDVPEQFQPKDHLHLNGKSIVMLLALDQRVIYTDGAEVDMSPAGVTVTFTQGGQEQTTPVARLGMSYEQAQEVLSALYHGIQTGRLLAQPKALPPEATDCPHPEHEA